ncbi:DUF3618 domain-containing protein [Sphingomonas nostoxanthinifaciens]|uniref:DUF3618 domain-containing protein n=1 Tax=Sphingomonas nostoxanthinifaciens TaxID=2872652 RepID=UPI001CC1C801|nr:DUF3618 domain-containing protein [Sphingomonas nostoxanthinifaciens]UAK23883.1 DUF3618 domain-containing protein [Sphingomonas nostoxanthinifaciens]
MSGQDLDKARAEANAARERLLGSAHALQTRLAPSVLAERAWGGVREGGEAAASKALGAVRARPVAASAIGIATIAFLARRPLARLIGRIAGAGARPATNTKPARRSRRIEGDRS